MMKCKYEKPSIVVVELLGEYNFLDSSDGDTDEMLSKSQTIFDEDKEDGIFDGFSQEDPWDEEEEQ